MYVEQVLSRGIIYQLPVLIV